MFIYPLLKYINDLANINTDLNILKNKDRDITYEDYLALSDEEQSNGTTYYVTDLEGSGGASSSSNCAMKYDPVTDMVYIKDLEGNWHEFMRGCLSNINLNLLSVDDWQHVSGTGAIGTFTVDPFYLKCGDNSVATAMETKNTYTVGKFNYIHIVGQAYCANVNVKFYIQLYNVVSGVVDYTFERGGLSDTPSFDTYIDISSLSDTAEYKIRVRCGQYNTTWLRFDTFALEN